MIQKNSLLNAYTALAPSVSHLGLLIAVVAVIRFPSDIEDGT